MSSIATHGPHAARSRPCAAIYGAAAAIVIAAAIIPPQASAADSPAFRGKTISVIVGNPPGGGYDTYARTLAAYIDRHIPGKPTLIVRNMPGASGLRAANHLAVKAPKDGTELLIFAAAVVFAPTLGNDKAQYKPQDLTWIGNIDQTTAACSVWHTSGVKSFKDLLSHQVIFGNSSPTGAASQYARSLNAMFGTKIQPIHGYPGTGSQILAMERGELHGACSFTLSALKTAYYEQYSSGKLKPVIQFALKSEELKGVPHINEFAKTDEDRQVIKLIFDRHRLGRPLAGPGGMPEANTATLRAAFDATMKDKDFQATAEKKRMDLSPMSGEEVAAFVREIASASPEALARTLKVLEIGEVAEVKLKSLEATVAGLSKNLLELKDTDGKSHNVRVSGRQTQIMIAGKPAKTKELKPGLNCTLSYFGEGDIAKTVACR